MSNQNNSPEDTLRDGSIKATIWRNEGDKGPYYTTTLARTYEDRSGKVKDSQSFSSGDLLKVGELARQAYHRSGELRREYARAQNQDRDQGQVQDRPNDREARREEFNERRANGSAPEPEHAR